MSRFLAVITVLGLGACAGDETATAYGAAEKVWVLQELHGSKASDIATLTFPAPGHIAGTAPCNSYNAGMKAPYPWFDAGPIAATRRACPALQAETGFFAALDAATQIEVSGDTLILTDDDGRQMVFTAAPDGD
ncbi:META domain-containing protein [Chachezhania antarctica]|uniref:META domain-containing protein n=1 Tax=Chachezhania antarctica TaxID=2340860 RepID=UPI000EAE9F37|nr:META domain-containing protein [Chachezhania antarctica]